MCGRITQSSSPQDYARLFGITCDLVIKPRYNIAPSNQIMACRLSAAGEKELITLHWGLVPAWSKGLDRRFSMINARAETLADKPAYRGPFKKQRCLIPADGFYEWHQENGKQPYYIHATQDHPLMFAGIWDHWEDDSGDKIDSCSIITCAANKQMQPIHERMPVILSSDQWDSWFNGQDATTLQSMLVPYRDDDMDIYQVSTVVNNPKKDGAGLIKPL